MSMKFKPEQKNEPAEDQDNDNNDEENTKLISGEAYLYLKNLDEESGYSQVYLTSVFHGDTKELKLALKKQFLKLSNEGNHLNNDEIMSYPDASFDAQFSQLNLNARSSSDLEDSVDNFIASPTQNLFWYALSVAFFISFIQISFIIIIIKEYIFALPFQTNDPELIAIRILSFVTITLKLWIEWNNGRKILIHSLYHSYWYRSNCKRFLCSFMGSIQISTALACYFCSSELIIKTQTVIDCVKDFSALIIWTEIDNWIGHYFISTNNAMLEYTKDNVAQIYVLKKQGEVQYTLADVFIDIIILGAFIGCLCPWYKSFVFSRKL